MSSIVKNITGAGDSGMNFRGQQADLTTPFTAAQATNMYKQAQDAQGQQQAFLAAIQAQNGLGNQSSVFNQYQNVANGTGPNPAQAMLNNATGQNVAQQAALMAGQRGASQNVGLMARQAAQQGAGIQQQAVGQGASMQAQQSLNAMAGMGNIANTQAAQQAAATGANTQAAQNQEQNLMNAIAQQNNAKVGMQSNVNNANASIAGITAGQQYDTFNSVVGQGAKGLMTAFAGGGEVKRYDQGGIISAPAVDANIGMGAPQAAPNMAGPSSKAAQYMSAKSDSPNIGTAANAAGAVIGKGLKSLFSSTPAPTSSGTSWQTPGSGQANSLDSSLGLDTSLTKGAASGQTAGADDLADMAVGADGGMVDQIVKLAPMIAMMAAKGGKVPALLSPGEKYLSPKDVKKVEKGENPMKAGKTVPGKAKVKGDKNSYANDTVPASLDSGGIVLPRSVTQSKNPDKKAAEFVRAIMAKNGKKLPKKA